MACSNWWRLREISLLNLYLKWKLVYEYVKDFKNEVSEGMRLKTHISREEWQKAVLVLIERMAVKIYEHSRYV